MSRLSLCLSIVVWVGLLACGPAPEEGEEPQAPVSKTDSRVRMGLALLQEGHIEAGMEHFRRLAEDPEQRIRPDYEPPWTDELVRELIRRRELELADSLVALAGPFEGRSAGLKYSTANLRVLQGRPAEAVQLYEQVRGDSPLMLRVHHELATLHLIHERFDSAIDRARQGLEIEPQQHSLRILIAEAMRGQNRPRAALAELSGIPAGADRWTAEGETYLLSLDRPDTAVVLLERALQASPQIPHVRYLLGKALLASGRADRAVLAFRPLARRARPFEESRRLLAEAYEAAGQSAPADSLRTILQAEKNRREWMDLRSEGLEHSQAGDLQAALEAFDGALELQPGHADLHNDRGAVLARLQRWDEAEQAFLAATRLNPTDRTVLENLARLYDRTGDEEARDRAIARWRTLGAAEDSAAAVDKD